MKRAQPIPPKVRDEVKERSRGICEAKLAGCLWLASELHHIKSRARGGTNTTENLAHLCSRCHRLITIHAPGTERWRTHSWQIEGSTEEDWRREFDQA